MKTPIAATLALMAMLTPALAEERYGRRLEAAAIGIVAAKMGSLRGGFGANEEPQFAEPIDRSQPTHLSAKRNPVVVPATKAEPRTSSFTSF